MPKGLNSATVVHSMKINGEAPPPETNARDETHDEDDVRRDTNASQNTIMGNNNPNNVNADGKSIANRKDTAELSGAG